MSFRRMDFGDDVTRVETHLSSSGKEVFVMHARQRTVAVIGASADRSKFGNKAVRAFRDQGWLVFPIHPHRAEIEGVRAYPRLRDVPTPHLDRVSFYVPPEVGLSVIDDLAGMSVGEIWLNPGSESTELLQRLSQLGLATIQACSILALGRDPGEYSDQPE